MLDSAAGAGYSGEWRAQAHPSSGYRDARRTVSWQRAGRRRLPWAGIWVVGRRVRLRGQWQGKPAPAKHPVGTSCPQGSDPEPSIVRLPPSHHCEVDS